MAQYNISVSGNQLIIELIVTDGDFAPSIVSIKNPSIKLTTDRIKFFGSGVYNMALFFNQINEIDGVAPIDLEDAADKIIALIANFNGGGAAPYKVYTALLTQSGTDAPVATVLENTLGGDLVWVRDNDGNYRVTSTELFTINKTHVVFGIPTNLGGFLKRSSADDDISNLYVYTLLSDGITFSDDVLNVSIEIRVYN